MKKVLLVFTIGLAAFFVLSCASKPEAVQEDPQENFQGDTGTALEKVYNKYRADLILENAQTYTVVHGDFLAAIARKFYGSKNGYFFPLIMLASSEVVLDPELIEPGMQLTIPDLEKNLANSDARDRIKSFLLDVSDVYEQKAEAMTDEERASARGKTRYDEDKRTKERLIELSNSLN
jgi:hypothetical protein